jgi:beta-N-acetylhexosaminidase
VDQEGGAVQTLKGSGFGRLPSAREQGALPEDQLSALAEGLGASLAAAGVNLDLAPVVDVVPPGTEAQNAPIGAFGREYGGTPEAVTAAAGTIVDGLSDAGVTATLKHFPGLGRVSGNTDDTAVVHDTVTTVDDPQLTVFSTLADSPAAPFVMASSAIYDRIDGSEQAMFSAVVLTDVLRGQLGFDGVVISDDVGNADAVAGVAVGDRAVRFVGAGGTLVLTVEADQFEPMVDAVLARAEDDAAFAEVVDAAVRTALLAKARAGLLG